MTIRLFNLDLHISVIADVKDVLKRLYADKIQIDDWSISGHTWVLNRTPSRVNVVNEHTWKYLNSNMVNDFVTVYKNLLSSYDGFIVTHTPVFCRLYESFGKPIFMVNSCRYDQPYCFPEHPNVNELQELNACLRRLNEKGLLIPISNNIADRDYLYLGTGIRSFHIPSLCIYTNIEHDPVYALNRRPMISCMHEDCVPLDVPVDPKPKHRYEWSDIMQRKALICIPYEVSTMSLFEHYSSGVPIFIPSKAFYKDLILSNKAVMCSFNTKNYWTGVIPKYLEETTNLDWWLDRCDYYDNENMPMLHYFDSWDHLIEQLNTFQLTMETYAEKRRHLEERKTWVFNQWKLLVEKTYPELSQ
jgi:hypothetical protein